jgi:hypothetical protein
VCLRNHRGLGVVNGTRATITHLDPHRRQIDAISDDGRPIILDRHYLDAGHVTHGYAITGHEAQGLTVDHAYVLGSQALYREWGYVALSRGRQTNHLYQTVLDQHLDEIHTHLHQPDDPHTSLAARMARTRAQQPVTPELRELAEQWRHLHVRLHEPDIARARTLAAQWATLTRHRQAELEQLERLQRRIEGATAGLGRMTNRHITSDLRDELDVRTDALANLDSRLEELDLERAGLPTHDRITQLRVQWRDLNRQLDAAARHRLTMPPDHLVDTLGPRPQARRPRRPATLAADSDRHRDLPVALGHHRPRPVARTPNLTTRSSTTTTVASSQRSRTTSTSGDSNANVAAAAASGSAVPDELSTSCGPFGTATRTDRARMTCPAASARTSAAGDHRGAATRPWGDPLPEHGG